MNNLPTITERTFGIEMEFVGASIELVVQTLNQVVDCHFEGYTHRTTSHWKVVTDGSLPNYSTCGEIVSPVLKGVEGVEQLRKVCDALDTIEGIKVTRDCGLHIHLGVEDLTVAQVQKVYERYADFEAQIDLIMPRSRRNNRWCYSISSNVRSAKGRTSKSSLARAFGKYHKVNLANLTTYGTIEFRHHSGTLNFRKIVNWLSFLQAFVETSRKLQTRTKRPSKQRAYHTLRTLLENNGLTLNYKSGRRQWIIEGSVGQRNTSERVQVREAYSGWELEELYATPRETSLVRSKAIEWLQEDLLHGIDYAFDFNAWEYVTEQVTTEGIAEQGWLTGVDASVQTYFEEREEELN
tara:strand:+ start:496 stop:1551 length:1056 start_codon:yes stop_codon:yes gene_type:complete